MHNLSLRYMKTGAAVSFLLMVGVLAHLVSDYLQFYGAITVSFITIGTLALTIFNMWLWNKPIISKLYQYPDMRGVYEGTKKYYYRNELNELVKGELKAKREIFQNGSGLFIRSTVFKPDGEVSSISTAQQVEVSREDDTTIQLIFHYRNEGSVEQGFPPHEGTEILRFTNNEGIKSITGKYYTNRTPFQTQGTIILQKTTNN